MHGGAGIRVTANAYLDHRRPSWLDAEMIGAVLYDWDKRTKTGSRLVEIGDARPDIQRACGGAA